MVLNAPPREEFRVVLTWYGYIDAEKVRVWLLLDRTLRVWRNTPGGSEATDYRVADATLEMNAASFMLDDGTTIRLTRSTDCCGWGAIQYRGPSLTTNRYHIEWVRPGDVPWVRH